MSLSNIRDWKLIEIANHWQIPIAHSQAIDNLIDEELELRYYQYGGCDNRLEFLPTEPEWDKKPVVEMEYYEENL